MASADTLQAIIDACEANILAAVTNQAAAGGLPNAPGQPDHGEYVQRQRETIAWAKQQLASASGPWVVETMGET
jgi:hypothetical protein